MKDPLNGFNLLAGSHQYQKSDSMISRHWIGVAKKDHVKDYIRHLEDATFPSLRKIAGFIDSYYLTRPVDRGVEFLVITEWESIEAIKEFAGENYERAVVPKEVQEMMVAYDKEVRHYQQRRLP
jgi:heme-degrading monooxygenase HmoA